MESPNLKINENLIYTLFNIIDQDNKFLLINDDDILLVYKNVNDNIIFII